MIYRNKIYEFHGNIHFKKFCDFRTDNYIVFMQVFMQYQFTMKQKYYDGEIIK